MSYGKYETSIALIEAEKETAQVVGIENIEAFKEERVKAKAYGTTFVNLLGSYGNFETDSNADGLADGWVLGVGTPSLDGVEIAGNYSQKITAAIDESLGIYKDIEAVASHVLFVSLYVKSSASRTFRPTFYSYGGWSSGTNIMSAYTATTSFVRRSAKWTNTIGNLRISFNGINFLAEESINFDGLQIIDLTAAGQIRRIEIACYICPA